MTRCVLRTVNGVWTVLTPDGRSFPIGQPDTCAADVALSHARVRFPITFDFDVQSTLDLCEPLPIDSGLFGMAQ